MTPIFKMAKLDFYTLKDQLSSYLVIPFVILILSPIKFSPVVLAIAAAWLPDLFHINVFAIQEKNGLERLYGSLAVSQREVILGRYLFTYAHFLIIYFCILIIGFALAVFHGQSVSMVDIMESFCFSFFLFTVISAPQFPIFYKMGYLKGKMLACIPYCAVMVLVILPSFYQSLSGFYASLSGHINMVCFLCLTVSLGAAVISYRVSILCYRKRR